MSNLTAQKADFPCYFVLAKGAVVRADSIRLEMPPMKKPYFLVDGKQKFGLNEWMAYENSEGYFHRYIDSILSYPVWYKREEKGKINLFSRFLRDNSANQTNSFQEEADLYKPYIYINQKILYSQIRDESPQKLRYARLTKLVESNAQSMALVKKGRQSARIKTTLIVSGVAILIARGLQTLSSANPISGDVKASGLMPVGLVIGLLPIVFKSTEIRCQEAVRVFNN